MTGGWPRATTIAILLALVPASVRAERVDADADEPAPTTPPVEEVVERPVDPPKQRPRTEPRSRRKDIVVVTPGERSSTNITVLAGMATVALAAGAVGFFYQMRSERAADAVSAFSFTGEAWSPQYEAEYDRANRYGITAVVLYGVGGAFLLTSIITFIATAPDSETTIIRPRAGSLRMTPIPYGAIVGRGWTF